MWEVKTVKAKSAAGRQTGQQVLPGISHIRASGCGRPTLVRRPHRCEQTRMSASDLPVNADLEGGYGHSPETVAETTRVAGPERGPGRPRASPLYRGAGAALRGHRACRSRVRALPCRDLPGAPASTVAAHEHAPPRCRHACAAGSARGLHRRSMLGQSRARWLGVGDGRRASGSGVGAAHHQPAHGDPCRAGGCSSASWPPRRRQRLHLRRELLP